MHFRQLSPFFILILCFVFTLIGIAGAQVPEQINFQGILNDTAGNPVPDGSYDMRFLLFDAETGGSQLAWNDPDGEEQSVLVVNGIYNIQLGAVEPLTPGIFSGGSAWLEIAIFNSETGTWETMTPRQQITSVPYALRAGNAERLGGQTISDLNATYVNIGETNAVTADMINDNSITANDLAPDSVAADEIADGAVTSSELGDNAVTADKLAPDSIDSGKILDGSVTSDDLAETYLQTSGGAIAGVSDGFLLSVINNNTAETAKGIYARGAGYGLYAEEVGDGDTGIYSPDFITGGGIRSLAQSTLWFPGTLAVKGNVSAGELSFNANGSAVLKRPAGSGHANIYLPISLPGNLFGQNVKVEEIRIYYRCSNSASYITSTWANRQNGASSFSVFAETLVNHIANTDAHYSLYPADNELGIDHGIINLHLYMYFNNGSDQITIGGVRVRMSHN